MRNNKIIDVSERFLLNKTSILQSIDCKNLENGALLAEFKRSVSAEVTTVRTLGFNNLTISG